MRQNKLKYIARCAITSFMENNLPTYIQILKNELERRKRVNNNYSLRSFARFLNLDSGVLSAILKNKRRLPKDKINYISERLKLEEEEKKYFIKSLLSEQKLKSKKSIALIKNQSTEWSLKDSHFVEENELTKKILSEWEYFAFLSLMDTVRFKNDIKWISRRLSILPERVEKIINDLLEVNIIKKVSDNELIKSKANVYTTHAVTSEAIKQSHREGLIKAKEKIDEVALSQRSYSSMTLSFNPNKMEEARNLIKEFRRQFSEILEKPNDGTEVYQLAIQFFPLTNLDEK